MSLEDIRNERIKKLAILRQRGMDPYPAETKRTHIIADVLARFSALQKSNRTITILGRVMARREHGGSAFFDVLDESGRMQIFFKEDVLGGESFSLLLDTVDGGDFISVEGHLFKTKRGEKTLEGKQWVMLAKSLRPLPEKWHGLQNTEEQFRKRYLDLLVNDGVKERFETRSRIITTLRTILEKNGFLEVETPMLHPVAGGALARPFMTHHNALDTDFFLRIAPELYLKRLLVGGFERVYEIGKSFRNEGIDVSHNPEFTMLECYAAYWSDEDMMKFVEKACAELAKAMTKKTGITVGDANVGFAKSFMRVSFQDVLKRYALISDYDRETRESMATRAKQFGIDAAPHESKGKVADEIYKKICRPYLIQPTFVTDHPLEISPLAKRRSERADEVRRFQLVVAGVEIMNGFAELNDPLDQRQRFEAQEGERRGGEEEAHRVDEDFLEALEYGMPPAAGLGVGIDRLAMLFTNSRNIRDVVLFPTLRPK